MDIASPDDLKPAITSVAETVGTIMNMMLGDNTGNWSPSPVLVWSVCNVVV